MPRVRAPALPPNFVWLNCDRPLSLKTLRGKVVLLDFWTYGCINCQHVMPDLSYLEQTYGDQLMVIGIHTAKFAHEGSIAPVQQAIQRYGLNHPVVLDQDFYLWQQYAVRAWPTVVVIDPQGYVIGTFAGEGQRQRIEQMIRPLLQHSPHELPKNPASSPADSPSISPDLPPLITPLAFPGKVVAAAAGDRLIVADSGHHRLVVTQTDGTVLDMIGSGQPGWQDGDFATAQFFNPQGIAVDPRGAMIYVADANNHALRQVDLVARQVSTLAGTGEQNRLLRPQQGKARQLALNSPWDVVQVGDRLFVAMAGAHQIWELHLSQGDLRTYAGTGAEFCVDGPIDQAAFAQPSGIATDGQELFVADSETSTIRAVTLPHSLPQDIITRSICGSGDLFGFGDQDGRGWDVRLQHCAGVAYGGDRQLWIADTYNHKIKQIDLATGTCTTLAGSGTSGFVDGYGSAACFFEPSGLTLTSSALYVADTNNHAIRQITLETHRVTTLALPGLCAPTVCLPPQAAPRTHG